MAQLKDLIVNGASQLIGDAYVNTIQITKINAPTTAGGSTYGGGTTGNVLTSNGTSIYWSPITWSSVSGAPDYILTSAKGTANGVASLDANGKVPSSQLPSYVDDVLEYNKKTSFPASGTSGIIYIAQDTNLTYRWSGTAYVEISPSLALGETSSTAYAGDKGKAAYAHAVTNKGIAVTNGLYKITANTEGHITAASAVTKTDITNLGIPAQDTNKYHKTGSWSGLTYTASAVNDADELKFTIPTGTTNTSVAIGNHTHGNITNDGKITGDGTAIGNGDRLVFVDATDSSNIIRKTNIAFDHATKTEFLSKEGSWISPIEYIEGTQTEVTNQWTGVTKETTRNNIYKGKVIAYRLPYDSATPTTTRCSLTLTCQDGTIHNDIAIYEAYASTNIYLTDIYPAGTILFLIYNGSKWQIINKKDSNIYEANLKWGGKNFAGDYGPIDGAMIDVLGANRFAFLKPAGLTVEYSTDNGSTWLDYGLSDTDKVGLFGAGGSAYLGKHNVSGTNTVQDQLRITINTSVAKIYTILNKIAIYMSTQGNTVDVKVEKALESTPTTYTTHLDWTKLNGWSGWNILNIDNLVTYGNTANTQYGRVRFIFRQTALYKNESNSARILRILGYGGMGWSTASNMAASGHIYSYDNNQITTFPNDIRITNMNIDKKATLATSAITTDRVFTFPDKNGTFALVSDIPTSFSTSNITGLATLTIGTATCQVFANNDITIPIYDGTIENTLSASEGVSF